MLRLVVRNPLGLHARPAARLVQTVGRYEAEVSLLALSSGRGPANARSINAVTTLGVRQGEEVEFRASGPQASEALAAIRALAEANYGDAQVKPADAPSSEIEAAIPTPPVEQGDGLAPGAPLRGLAGSPGLAFGPARHVSLQEPPVTQPEAKPVADPQAEWQRLLAAIAGARAEIEAARQNLASRERIEPGAGDATAGSADILTAHLLFLQDDALLGPAREGIVSQGLAAAQAWQRAVDAVAEAYRALDDPYLRSRAADIMEVGRQVMAQLPGGRALRRMPRERGILLADDLSAAEVAQLDLTLVQGICTAYGAPTAHSTILARSLGIPAVVGLGQALAEIAEGTPLIVDGHAGEVFPNPDERTRARHVQRAEALHAVQEKALASRMAPAVTRDGHKVQVLANIGAVADARAAIQAGAEGVGVLRTEFLFLNRSTAPDEEEQYAAYRAIAAALDGRPLTIRTLDVGGDKPLPYLAQPQEANPFLGWRAVRLTLERPEILLTQLTAILRTAIDFPVQVLLPMIATLTEWRACRGYLERAAARLRERGLPPTRDIPVGIMVEVPAAALQAVEFAAEVDFLSIGTNDLAQYVLAAERGNPRVAALSDALQPAVLRMIAQVVRAAHAQAKPVAVCGELAGEPLAVPLLVGLGVDELSMNMAAVPLVKQIVRELSEVSATRLARRVLRLATVEEVRAALTRTAGEGANPEDRRTGGGRGSRGIHKNSRP